MAIKGLKLKINIDVASLVVKSKVTDPGNGCQCL